MSGERPPEDKPQTPLERQVPRTSEHTADLTEPELGKLAREAADYWRRPDVAAQVAQWRKLAAAGIRATPVEPDHLQGHNTK